MCETFTDNECKKWTYAEVRAAMKGKPYPMSLTSPKEIEAVCLVVNQGIDSHLEACFAPSRGDSYKPGERRLKNGALITTTLECRVSVESLPVLLRRLFELPSDDMGDGGLVDTAESLASAILDTLFDDSEE